MCIFLAISCFSGKNRVFGLIFHPQTEELLAPIFSSSTQNFSLKGQKNRKKRGRHRKITLCNLKITLCDM